MRERIYPAPAVVDRSIRAMCPDSDLKSHPYEDGLFFI